MKIVDRLLGRAEAKPPPRRRAAQIHSPSLGGLYEAAKADRFNVDWLTSGSDANAEIFYALEGIRARSRELAANNPYMRRWLLQVKQNVIGHKGIRFVPRVRTRMGALNDAANTALDQLWRRWTRRGVCEVTGRLSWWMLENLYVETLMRDGEFLLELRPGYPRSPLGYAVKVWDSDRLDHRLNQINHENGNQIIMGVEVDADERAVAYHLLAEHPGAMMRTGRGTQQHIRVPADRMVHVFIPFRPEQMRGIPSAHAAMLALRDLGQWRASAIIAARAGANKLAWWKTGQPDSGLYGDEEAGVDGETLRVDNAGPGETGVVYDPDAELIEHNPTYPHQEFSDFNSAMLQGIAGGLGTFYPTLANDYARINLSSIRGGLLDERDGWRVVQKFSIQSLHEIVQRDWLTWMVFSGRAGRSPASMSLFARIDRLDHIEFRPRGWATPDPLKDAQSDAIRYGMKTKSLREIVEQDHEDAEEVWRDIADEKALLEGLGLEPVMPTSLQPLDTEPPGSADPDEETAEQDEDED